MTTAHQMLRSHPLVIIEERIYPNPYYQPLDPNNGARSEGQEPVRELNSV
jgi:hypothetical protein